MTIRMKIAAMALQGFCALDHETVERGNMTPENTARVAVAHADALLCELEKESAG